MTPKEKAQELVKKYEIQFLSFGDYLPTIKSKQCALIAVNEILNVIEDEREGFNWKTYYLEVKQEIEKL